MPALIPIVFLGFFLGMRHATDADHVIAISTIVSRQRAVKSAAVIGACWGLGHTLTLMAVGIAIAVFGLVVPPKLGMSMEFSVGLMLILLGAWNLKAFTRLLPFYSSAKTPHGAANEELDDHADAGLGRWFDSHFGRMRFYQLVRPFLVGIVHGLAGSAALALLVLTMIHDTYWAVIYLAVFGVGTIAGMMMITAAIAWPFAYTLAHSAILRQRLAIASGLLSLGFGIFMVYQIGFVDGLLTK